MKEIHPCKFFHLYRHQITQIDHGPTTSIQLIQIKLQEQKNVTDETLERRKVI
jgi:hypothetical protein